MHIKLTDDELREYAKQQLVAPKIGVDLDVTLKEKSK